MNATSRHKMRILGYYLGSIILFYLENKLNLLIHFSLGIVDAMMASSRVCILFMNLI